MTWYAPLAGENIQAWSWLIAGWLALRERSFYQLPRGSWPAYGPAVASAASAISVTEGGPDTYSAADSDGWATVVFDHIDPRYVVRAAIDHDASSNATLAIVPVGDWTMRIVNGGGIGAGSRYAVLGFENGGGSSDGTIWWSDRVPVWPNDRASETGTSTTGTATTLTMAGAAWPVDGWRGQYLYVRVGSQTRIIAVESNSADTLTFAALDTAVGSGVAFAIYDSDHDYYWSPEHVQSGYVYPWYRGNMVAGNWSRDPTGGLSSAATHAAKTWQGMPSHPWCLDVDYWTPVSGDVPRDTPASATIWQSIRQLQAGAIALCSSFTPGLIDDGPPLNFVGPAHAFGAAGYGSNLLPNSLYFWSAYQTRPEWSEEQFDDRGGSGNGLNNVALTDSDGVPIGIPMPPFTPAGIDTYNGFHWQGFTRVRPLEFRYMHARSCFMPSLSGSEYYPTPVDAAGKAGDWQTKAASTAYLECDYYGTLLETQGFATDDLARFVGDNFQDPTTYQAAFDDNLEMAQYEDRWYTGVTAAGWRDNHQGVATAGGSDFIEDAAADWPTQGTVQTETGTATGGDAQTVVDTSKSGSYFWAVNRWAGLIVEVQDSGGIWHARPIISSTPTSLSLFGSLPMASSGKDYRIVAPVEINHWQGRGMAILAADGSMLGAAVIRYSDGTRLFFDAPVPALPAWDDANPWRYVLVDPKPGSVWRWNGTAWVVPASGAKAQFAQAPGVMIRAGLICRGDYIGPWIFTEFKAAMSALTKTFGAPSWQTPDDGNGQYNGNGTIDYSDGATASVSTAVAAVDGRVSAAWTPTTTTANPPAMRYDMNIYEDLSGNPPADPPPIDTGDAGAYSHRGRGAMTNQNLTIASVEFFNWANEFSQNTQPPNKVVWSAYGQAVALRAWASNGSSFAAPGEIAYGDVVGDSVKPGPPGVGLIGHIPVDTDKYWGAAGFRVVSLAAVVTWAFAYN